jgi:hypothetical protein
MKKTIISLSIVAGLLLCGGLHSSNKAVEAKNCIKSGASMDIVSMNYAIVIKTDSEDPGILPPK